MNNDQYTVVLIHGLWMTPHSWEGFRNAYEQSGYTVIAPAWPRMQGDVAGVRSDPSAMIGLGLLEIADHFEGIVRSLRTPAILVGHSIGGFIVQMLLDRGVGVAGVSISGTMPTGVYRLPLSVLRAASPVLLNPLNNGRNVMLTFKQFRYAFAHIMSENDARAAYNDEVVPAPGRPLFQVALGNFNPWAVNRVNHLNSDRAPLLIIAGSDDNLVPSVLNRINFDLYRRSNAITEYKEFAHRSHLIVAQEGWEEVADYARSWFGSMTGHLPMRDSSVQPFART